MKRYADQSSLLTVTLMSVLTLLLLLGARPGQSQDLERSVLGRVFQTAGFIPVQISRNQTVGDIYGIPNLNFVASSRDCFENIVVETTPQQLRSITMGRDTAMAASLGLGQILSVGVDYNMLNRIEVSFEQVQLSRASEVAIRRAFKRQECAEFVPFIDGSALTEGVSYPLIVGEVFTAVRTVRLTFRNRQAANAQLSAWTALAQRLGMSASLTASASDGVDSAVVMTGGERIVVGLRPAFIPIARTQNLLMGAASSATPSVVMRMEAYEGDLSSHQRALMQWVSP